MATNNNSYKLPILSPPDAAPAIMESIDSIFVNNDFNFQEMNTQDCIRKNLPDITLTSEFTSLKLGAIEGSENIVKSFVLIDGDETLKVHSGNKFISKLGCDVNTKAKVIAIFGVTGEGKSHTLNYTFFNGDEVFRTSNEQDSCTLGVWSSYDPLLNVICLDTEGLQCQGSTAKEKQRIRMLLKVLAISDIVVYRTKSERLPGDMFKFLGSASKAYSHHFQTALQSLGNRSDTGSLLSTFGPAVVIFHETRFTSPLTESSIDSPEDIIKSKFQKLGLSLNAFCSVTYVGIQTKEFPTNFHILRKTLASHLINTAVRFPRSPIHVYNTLKMLNDKFNGNIEESTILFPDEYFTCPVSCLSCNTRCQSSMGHVSSYGTPHCSKAECKYQKVYDNILHLCKTCFENKRQGIIVLKQKSDSSLYGVMSYVWSGYILECPNCGVIYRSRQYWYGNTPPEVTAVKNSIHHIWPGTTLKNQNSVQKVLDSVSSVKDNIANVTFGPTKVIGEWAADKIAPKYWKPNEQIKECCVCKVIFTNNSKHHCRWCGDGVCNKCSMSRIPVPQRNWNYPVRVCDICYRIKGFNFSSETQIDENHDREVTARKVGEAICTTVSNVASVLSIPKVIVDTARPAYWTPNSDILNCCVCNGDFNTEKVGRIHHCRDCGEGVCNLCSMNRHPVPHRGWPDSVRVCNNCFLSNTSQS